MTTDSAAGNRVSIEHDGAVAVVIIDNPPVNASSREVRQGMLDAICTIASDDAVRAAIIIGGGNTFIAGADLREFGKPFEEPQLPAVIAAIEQCPKPVVAAIHGASLGGGYELALGCDARVTSPDAVVGLPEVTLGMIPGAGGTQRLPRFVGKSKAMDLVLTGRMMDAAEAERCGLVSRVVPLADLMNDAIATAEKIAGMSLPATMIAKEAVNRAFETTLAEGVRFERRTFHATFAFEDRAEGMAAFADKRKANWKHR
jgi:enoyl-CoA hydratase